MRIAVGHHTIDCEAGPHINELPLHYASLLFSSRGAATVDTNAMLWAQFGMPDSLVRNSEPRWEGSAPPSGRRSPSSNFLEQGSDCLKKDERMGGLGQHLKVVAT